MGEKIALLGVDKRVPTDAILAAAAAARDALGEETPDDFYVYVQRPERANRVRWFGLLAKMKSRLYPPSGNVADCMAEALDHLVFVRFDGTCGTGQFEHFVRRDGKTSLRRALAIVDDGERVRAVDGTIENAAAAHGDDANPIAIGLSQTFEGETDEYWNTWDEADFFVLAKDGHAHEPPTKIDAQHLGECKSFLPHFADDDDIASMGDPDDEPPPESGEQTHAARAAPVAIPTTWPELLARLSARIALMDAKLDALGAPTDDGFSLVEPTDYIAARAILEGPVSCVPWLQRVGPRFTPVLTKVKRGFGAPDAIGFAKHLVVVRACGVDTGPEVEAFAVKMLDLIASDAASLTEKGRLSIALLALGLGAYDAVGRCYGQALPARVTPGETHSFGYANHALYLAAGLKAKQPARDLEPAWREIVSYFPYGVHLKKLDYADLFAFGRAWYSGALGKPSSQIAKLLHDEVRGGGPAAGRALRAVDAPLQEPPAERAATWPELVAKVRAAETENVAWIDDAIARLASSPPDARWLLLGMIGEVLNKLTIACGPVVTAPIFARIDPLLPEWINELRGADVGRGERLACGLLYFDAARCSGAPLLPVAAAAERFVYPQLAPLARELRVTRRTAMALSAIALGAADVVESFLKPPLDPSRNHPDAEALARALASGADPTVAWSRLVAAFPQSLDGKTLSWSVLMNGARAFLSRCEQRATDTVAQRLHEIANGKRAAHQPWAPPTSAAEFGIVYNAQGAVLTIDGAGVVKLGHARGEWEASLAPAAAAHVFGAIVQGLAAARFPWVAPHHPGQAYRSLCANGASGESVARVEWNAALAMPGYRELFTLLDNLVVQASEGAVPLVPSTMPAALASTRRIR